MRSDLFRFVDSSQGLGAAAAGAKDTSDDELEPQAARRETTDTARGLDAGCRTLDAEWYAIQTKPRAEEKTIQFLSLKAIPTFLPQILVNRHHGSGRWQALEPLFPGYLFAQFAPEPSTIATIRWTPGVSKILGDDESPIPVPNEVLMHLQYRMGGRGFVIPGPVLAPGMRVRFRRGPLAYMEGIIERPPSRAERVRVLLELLNRSVRVEIDLAELEPV